MSWFREFTVKEIHDKGPGTLAQTLGMEITEIGPDFLRGTMPVDQRTFQPAGILHGGASVALAETLGSLAAYMSIDPDKYYSVGLDINANHIRSVREGIVTGTAKAIHIGKTTHVWEIKIENAEGKLVCISRITMAILSITKPQ